MIAVDTSALMAILQDEAQAEAFLRAIATPDHVLLGAPTAFEFRLVVLRQKGPAFLPAADRLLRLPTIEIVPWTGEHGQIAIETLTRFGGRPARLNYGDCMAYAVAALADCPLLFKGDDFRHTDIVAAL
ncbi:ribonuclease VapC [Sphingomonas trueperi]|uniref:type II toxin-antitoxin system VapC family toxin n=1 Tax=Sphingomonas trueperi TaxID=53317 RepID=UPI003397AFB9